MIKKCKLLSFVAVFAALFAAQGVLAQDKIGYPEVVPYAEDAKVRQAIKDECKLGEKASIFLGKYLKQAGQVPDKPASGKYLDIRITEVHANGGGMYSGPKWLEIQGTLNEDGKVGPSFRAKRFTTGGMRACSAAARCVKAVSKDIFKWSQNPVDGAELGDAK